jgi:hypothetical protein
MGYVTNQNVDLQFMILLNSIVHHSCTIWVGGGGGGEKKKNLKLNYGQILVN